MVVDEFGEGFSVAWCISNKQDKSLVEVLFQSVRERVGTMTPHWLKTDDASQFYSAWVTVFGDGPNKLVCNWHVNRAWRTQLNQIKSQELSGSIYKNLRVFLEEPQIEIFEKLLTETTQQLLASANTKMFGNYFVTHYANRKQQWATCYRISSGINTNMYVESFQFVLEYIYEGESQQKDG